MLCCCSCCGALPSPCDPASGARSWTRTVLALPMDYAAGTLCARPCTTFQRCAALCARMRVTPRADFAQSHALHCPRLHAVWRPTASLSPSPPLTAGSHERRAPAAGGCAGSGGTRHGHRTSAAHACRAGACGGWALVLGARGVSCHAHPAVLRAVATCGLLPPPRLPFLCG